MGKPLHQRLRELIPDEVKKRIPESVKDKIRPPAWREPEQAPFEAPEVARGQKGELKFVWGDPAMVWGDVAKGGGTVVTEDSKGYKLPSPVKLPYGTTGKMVATGPDFVVVQFGDGPDAARYRVNKRDVVNTKPEHERKFSQRRRVVEVTIQDLRGAHART